jgi:hypothetical protein
MSVTTARRATSDRGAASELGSREPEPFVRVHKPHVARPPSGRVRRRPADSSCARPESGLTFDANVGNVRTSRCARSPLHSLLFVPR